MSTRTTIFVLIVAAALAAVGASAQTPAELIPHGQFTSPQILIYQNESRLVPTTVTLGFDGTDPDTPDQRPAAYRVLMNRALISEEAGYAASRVDVMENLETFASFADSAWTAWMSWPDNQQITFSSLPAFDAENRRINYVAALQVMDADGAVSVDRRYGINLLHFRVGDVDPGLAAYEPTLGDFQAVGPDVVVPLDVGADTYEFQWAASAESYGSEIVAYRWGLDLVDPDDPDDPGWAGPPGLDPANLTTGPFDLTSGIHNLTIQAEDAAGGFTRLALVLNVIPIPDPANQLPLLMVDDVYDQASNGWQGSDGTPLDRDVYRDAFWEAVLGGTGGVAGFEPARDVVDCEDGGLGLRDAVQYRAIAWNTRWVTQQHNIVDREFRPTSYYDEPYVWLAQYQERVGNLLLSGQRVTDSFHHESRYALPIVFESTTGFSYNGVIDVYRVGFGEISLPDGSTVQRGPTRYGYRTLGLSVVDQTSPTSDYVLWGTGEDPPPQARQARKAPCAALKSLVLDPDFAALHMPGGPAFPDTITTEDTIDWRDVMVPGYSDDLANPYIWGNDEFYEAPGLRDDPFTYQTCDGAPGGLCVEPMFRSQARFDWIRQQHLEADPGDDWPDGYYTESELDQLCGEYLLDDTYISAQATTDEIVGFLTHKPAQDRPNLVADVVWGFDPYRFDHGSMTEAIRWVLGEHFGLTMNP